MAFGKKDKNLKQEELEKDQVEKEGKEEKPKKTMKQEIFEWVMVFVVAAAMAFVVRTFLFEPVRVDGPSMLNTLEDGDLMIATKFDYLSGDPERFDVVICNYPNATDGKYRVKRVVGMPGEKVQLVAGRLYVNDVALEQDFEMTSNTTYYGPIVVPEGHYFVLGDNRNNSKDSRDPSVGCLPRSMIKGHVRAVVFPFDNAAFIEN